MHIYAVNAKTGHEIMKFKTGGRGESLAIADGVAYSDARHRKRYARQC